jgi:hypothetical protein
MHSTLKITMMQGSLGAYTFYLISYTVKLSLYVIKHHFMQGYGRLEVLLRAFLTLMLTEVSCQLLTWAA